MIRKLWLLATFSVLTLCTSVRAQPVIYDGLITGTVATFTGSTPRTYMGQGFSVADPGSPVMIGQMRVVLVAGGAVNYAASRLRVQFWDVYDPTQTGTNLVFSSSITNRVFNTGAINVAGATAFTYTLPFATPVTLTGLTNHGITFNWQSDVAGNGTFIDDTLLTTALRTGTGGTIPPPALTAGADLNPGGGYFRNASGLTTFNFQAGDARTIANVGGLMFEITAVAVPEPATVVMIGLAGSCIVGGWCWRKRQLSKQLESKLR